jgi:signal transduction histidine kinase
MAGKGGRSWSDALLSRPWLLVVAVALFVALPVLVLGQASESDTRGRLQAAQIDSAARAADAVKTASSGRLEAVRQTLAAVALTPRVETSPIGLAVQRGDNETLQSLVDMVQRLYVHDVLRTYVVVRGQAPLLAEGTITAAAPAGTDLVGRRIADVAGPAGAAVLSTLTPGPDRPSQTNFSTTYSLSEDAPSRVAVVANLATAAQVAQRASGFAVASAAIAADLDLARLFAEASAPSMTTDDDAYLVDESGRLLGRVRGATPFPLRELRGTPVMQLVGAGPVARAGVADPLSGATRLAASARLPGTDWWVLVLRDTSAVNREIDSVLGQLATARYVLVALLLIGAFVIARAASTTVRQRRALAEANERVEIASLHKSAFLANMSHELRTPLNSINGFSDVLLTGIGGPLTEKQREYLADIRGSGDHLLALVNDVLDLSKVEAGKMDLNPTEFDVAETIDGIHRTVAPLAQQKRQRLEFEIGGIGAVRADHARLRQVLLNVLSNAVKYTPEGGSITATAARRDGMVAISVRDSGVGIAPQDQQRVFDDFTRIDSAYVRGQQGTGLGLSLARRLARLMGGDITLESEPGQGSTFTVTVPAA